jgi:hypothetical protein
LLKFKIKIKEQLKEHEPCVDSEKTQFADGLLFTGEPNVENISNNPNELKMTVGLQTIYNDRVDVAIDLSEEQKRIFSGEE